MGGRGEKAQRLPCGLPTLLRKRLSPPRPERSVSSVGCHSPLPHPASLCKPRPPKHPLHGVCPRSGTGDPEVVLGILAAGAKGGGSRAGVVWGESPGAQEALQGERAWRGGQEARGGGGGVGPRGTLRRRR